MVKMMSVDDCSDPTMNTCVDLDELAQTMKADQERQEKQMTPKGAAYEELSPKAREEKIEEMIKKGWLNAPQPKPQSWVYHAEDKFAFLKRVPKEIGKTRPYAVNEIVERGKNSGIIDLYSRRAKSKSLIEIYEEEALLPNTEGKVDLYRERVKSRRPPTASEQTALALIKKYGLR